MKPISVNFTILYRVMEEYSSNFAGKPGDNYNLDKKEPYTSACKKNAIGCNSI